MTTDADTLRDAVRDQYDRIARDPSACCGPPDHDSATVAIASTRLGYSAEELKGLPDGADLGLGCGNPTALASLQPGETVLDLGSGAGIDCFLAARRVGDTGRVIGVDMTPSMISKARKNAATVDASNVEFRLGEIEHVPVADSSVDVIISNCVINLSPDKPAVYGDAFRVLRPGGRLAISDVVALTDLPKEIKSDIQLYGSCTSGAATVPELETMLTEIGFEDISIDVAVESRDFIEEWAPGSRIEDFVASASIEARKPVTSSQ